MLWKSVPAETQCLMCHTQRDNLKSVHIVTTMTCISGAFSCQIPNKTSQEPISLLVLQQKVHLQRCTFCQKIGGCRVMKNHTIVQLDWVPHLQHSHKVTHTFLKTLWRHGALQHLLKSWPLKLALWSERLGKEPLGMWLCSSWSIACAGVVCGSTYIITPHASSIGTPAAPAPAQTAPKTKHSITQQLLTEQLSNRIQSMPIKLGKNRPEGFNLCYLCLE